MPLSRSPEAQLVFRSADVRCGSAELAPLAAVIEDWGRAVHLADGELATPTLWRALREVRDLPAPVAEALRRAAMFGDFRMQQLAGRLQQTIAAFAAAQVPVVLLKGAALGAIADPSFRLRPMTDLDLLVVPEDVPRARAALVAAGWQETEDPTLHALLDEGHHHLPPYFDPQLPGMRVELHVALFPADHSFAFDETHLRREARPAAAPFASALVPSPEHLVLHACIHFAWQHAMEFGAWRTFRLVGVASTAPGFSWERLTTIAREARAATSCYWTLRLGQRMGALEVPPAVLAALAPPHTGVRARGPRTAFHRRARAGRGAAEPVDRDVPVALAGGVAATLERAPRRESPRFGPEVGRGTPGHGTGTGERTGAPSHRSPAALVGLRRGDAARALGRPAARAGTPTLSADAQRRRSARA